MERSSFKTAPFGGHEVASDPQHPVTAAMVAQTTGEDGDGLDAGASASAAAAAAVAVITAPTRRCSSSATAS